MRSGRLLVVLLVTGLVFAPGAVAAKLPASPAGVPVATGGGRTLFAHDEGKLLCVSFAARDGDASCEAGGATAVLDDAERATGASGSAHLGVAVPAGATSVELRRAGRLLATAPTQPGSRYTGRRAGKVVFAILSLPKETPESGLRVRALDGSGAPVAVLPVGDGDLLGPERSLLRGQARGTRWNLTRRRVSRAASALFDLDHETVEQCLTVNVRAGRRNDSAQGACLGGAPVDSVFGGVLGPGAAPAFQDECSTGFRLVSGLAPAGSRVGLVLGNGSRLMMRTAPFESGRVAYAGVVPAGAAVRALRVTTRGRTRTTHLLAAPLRVSCAAGSSASYLPGIAASSGLLDLTTILGSSPVVTPEGPVVRVPGEPSFRLADGPAGSLCLALGVAPFRGLACPVVGPGYEELAASIDDYERPRAIVIAVPAEVASVRIGRAKGPLRTIQTVTADGYAGRYAGLVRFAAVSVDGYRDLSRLELRDADGKLLWSEGSSSKDDAPDAAPKRVGARRLAGSPGRRSLWRTTYRYDGPVQCSAITDGPAPRSAEACQSSGFGSEAPEVLLDVPCSTHRVTVAAVVGRGSRVSVRDSRGRTRRLDTRGGGALLELPPSVGADAVIVRRAGKRQRIRLAAPAGARQCGYRVSAQPDLD